MLPPRNSFKAFRGLPRKSKQQQRHSKANLIRLSMGAFDTRLGASRFLFGVHSTRLDRCRRPIERGGAKKKAPPKRSDAQQIRQERQDKQQLFVREVPAAGIR